MKISLRLKLTLWFLAYFATVYIAVIAIALVFYRGSMRRSLDHHMTALAEATGQMVLNSRQAISSRHISHFQPVDRRYSVVAVRAEDGHILASHEGVDTLSLPPLPAVGQATAFRNLAKDDAMHLVRRRVSTRMLTYRAARPNGPTFYIDLVRTTNLAEEERAFTSNAVVIGAVGALLAFGLAAWLLAGRAVWPLVRLTEAARELGLTRRELVSDATGKEVERLQAGLNEAMKRLEDGFRARERFLDYVAHDLKTPLSVMLAESQALRPGSATSEELEAYRRSVVEELWRLAHLVHGMLALARADEAETLSRLTTVYINDVIVECVSMCKGHADSSGVALEPELIDPEITDAYPEFLGDPDLMCAMLANLIHNAIRFSPRTETVNIRAEMANGNVHIHVRDRGPGIPEEYLDRVFDRFVQVPSDGMHKGGSGIGLAIARTVAESHGGSVRVRNCADRGCEFTVTLPLKRTRVEV